MRVLRTTLPIVLPMVGTLALVTFQTGCSDSCDATFPVAPAGATSLVHVAACGEDGDGSAESPYATIGEAIAAAPAGAAVLVAAGTYAESVTINKPLSLVGSSSPVDPSSAGAVITGGPTYGVTVDSMAGVVLQGLRVEAAAGIGIYVRNGASATIDGCWVTGTSATAAEPFGYGILVNESHADVHFSRVDGSAGAGILYVGSTGEVTDSFVSGNLGGGIRSEDTQGPLSLEKNVVQANYDFGMAILSSRGIIIIGNKVASTTKGALGAGDGLVVASLADVGGASEVTVQGANELTDNLRMGILFSGDVSGTIDGATVAGNGHDQGNVSAGIGGGIWLQAGAGTTSPIAITNTSVTGSRFVGVEVTSGAVATLDGSSITGTTEASRTDEPLEVVTVGDGLAVYDGALVTATNLIVDGNGRMGVIATDANLASSFNGLTISGSGTAAMVFQSDDPNTVPTTDFGMVDVVGLGTYQVSASGVTAGF